VFFVISRVPTRSLRCSCSDPAGSDGSPGRDAGDTEAAAPDAEVDGFPTGPNTALGFNPSNAGLLGNEASVAGDVVISGPDCDIHSEQGRWDCVDLDRYVRRFASLPSGKWSVPRPSFAGTA
jgi:hypothetical protein